MISYIIVIINIIISHTHTPKNNNSVCVRARGVCVYIINNLNLRWHLLNVYFVWIRYFYKFLIHKHPTCSLQCIFFYVDITFWEGFRPDYAWIMKRGHSECSFLFFLCCLWYFKHYNDHGIKCQMAWYPKLRQICFRCIFIFKLLKLPIHSITKSKLSDPTNVSLLLFGSSNLSDNDNKFIFIWFKNSSSRVKRFLLHVDIFSWDQLSSKYCICNSNYNHYAHVKLYFFFHFDWYIFNVFPPFIY